MPFAHQTKLSRAFRSRLADSVARENNEPIALGSALPDRERFRVGDISEPLVCPTILSQNLFHSV